MKKAEGFNQERTFGIEIEFFGVSKHDAAQAIKDETGIECRGEYYNHETQDYWKIVSDASVDYEGLELVSPPLAGDEGLKELENVLEALNGAGAEVNRSCGIHVHHDVNDYELRNFKQLLGLYIRYEPAIDELFPKSRRKNNNRYCRTFSPANNRGYGGRRTKRDPHNMVDRIKRADCIQDMTSSVVGSKYFKLNFNSYRKYGTVEFRQHSGSTDYRKLSSWIFLTQAMVERAGNSTLQIKAEGAKDWFNFKKAIRAYGWMGADDKLQNAIKFFNKRRRHFADKFDTELISA